MTFRRKNTVIFWGKKVNFCIQNITIPWIDRKLEAIGMVNRNREEVFEQQNPFLK
jgi:hypothetical protein